MSDAKSPNTSLIHEINLNSSEQEYREVPSNIEAEQGLLGAILINNESYDKVSGFLKEEHFYEGLHGRIFDAAAQMIQMGQLATPVTMKDFFIDDPVMQEIGGVKYLARLAVDATSVFNIRDFGRTILDLAIRRGLINVGAEIVELALDADINSEPAKQIEQAEQSLYNLSSSEKYGGGFKNFASAGEEVVSMTVAAHKNEGGLAGISTGINDLDQIMGGLQKSDLIVLAGRPSMGKTALATNIAFRVANAHETELRADGEEKTTKGGSVAFFSLEMSSEQLGTRIISEQAEVSSSDMRRGKTTEEEVEKVIKVTESLSQIPLYIDDTGGLTIGQISARARRLKRQKGLDLIILDYIQLLLGSGKSNSNTNRVQEITAITMGLKSLAKELDVPVIALSQLNRNIEQREDKRPMLSDLRESGSIEQDADVVCFVYREEYYVERSQPHEDSVEHSEWQVKMDEVMGKAEVIVAKQRHGPVGTVPLQFEGKYTRFSDFQKDEYLPMRRDQ